MRGPCDPVGAVQEPTLDRMPSLHPAAVIEDAINERLAGRLTDRGWRHKIVPATGYGSDGFVRILARVLFTRSPEEVASADVDASDEDLRHADDETRGWRAFIAMPAVDAPVTIHVGDRAVTTHTDRTGLVDFTIRDHGLAPGWRHVRLASPAAVDVEAAVHIVAPTQRFGIISDIDDTILTTNLPRPLTAFWNTFVRAEAERIPVPGMATMYRELLADHAVPGDAGQGEPGTEVPVIYVSTGAWNTAPHLTRFMRRNGFPQGPMLLTDWGPTNSGWFRSGADHKRAQLRRIARELPHVRWVLIGDTGQKDPMLYREFVEEHPELVRAVALRQLSFTEQVVSHGGPPLPSRARRVHTLPETPVVQAHDGYQLGRLLRLALADD